eukprot:gene14243-biopygen23108
MSPHRLSPLVQFPCPAKTVPGRAARYGTVRYSTVRFFGVFVSAALAALWPGTAPAAPLLAKKIETPKNVGLGDLFRRSGRREIKIWRADQRPDPVAQTAGASAGSSRGSTGSQRNVPERHRSGGGPVHPVSGQSRPLSGG